MKFLLVNGYSHASHERFQKFKHHVVHILRHIEVLDASCVGLEEKHRSDLGEYIFELHSDNADPLAITRFDHLDFVFLDGDSSIPPWHPGLKKVCRLVKMCMMTGKCLFGGSFAASLLAYMCSTGGDMIHVVNGNGKGAPLKSLQSVPPPTQELQVHEVLLDSDTGDFYTYSPTTMEWEPKGNTGIIVHCSDRDRDYGARPNSARGGTRKRHDKDHAPVLSRLADMQCCGRLEQQNHVYLKGLRNRQFVVNCPSKWDLDEKITSTSGNKYTVFVDSQRGPLLIEFGNALCAHFSIAKEYPETCTILENYVVSKVAQIKIHEHVDRSYMASVSGMISHGTRTGQAKYLAPVATEPPKAPAMFDATNKGKTSPKKVRPLSAANVAKPKTRPHSATPTMLAKHDANGLRRTPVNNQGDGDDDDVVDRTKTALDFVPPHVKGKGQVKVCRLADPHKPYCAYERFQKIQARDEKSRGGGYYSVVNDAPYVAPDVKEIVESEKSKLRWKAGPFRTAFGKASTHIHPEEGILGANFPYNVRHTPAHVLEPDRNFEHPTPSSSSSKKSGHRTRSTRITSSLGRTT
ncbi:Aste57867_21006 [Aphanomyces stellatus]|uniref:Aste57867_21006 protein n=1 Tax=Aphanomyces stellatus TaxID=120398 RepID=A0A485LGI9_9STRA|nr:hypothetical protein As57867_020938 [Aphanomyces stellatus]VFT97681.1 Aste57867_21006 [Aphanomyces stellatus]